MRCDAAIEGSDPEHLAKVVQVWRRSELTKGTIHQFLAWIRRLHAFCRTHDSDVSGYLTHRGAIAFAGAYRGPRKGPVSRATKRTIRTALRAWYYALSSLGLTHWEWKDPTRPPSLPRILDEYRAYRLEHCGVAVATWPRDLRVASLFLSILRKRRGRVATLRAQDIDDFVLDAGQTHSRQAVVDACSSLRGFLRFLYASGRTPKDTASLVSPPRVLRHEKPPRRISWSDVQRILRVIERRSRSGRRDYALFLLMATYGIGTAEALHLRMQDIDWRNNVLRVYRPKTKVAIDLPLLPAVGRAIAAYIKHERPWHVVGSVVFVSRHMPHVPLSSSAVRHRVRLYARQSGITADILGGHLFRHSHATRQIDLGINPKVLSDILGHRDPSSTSRYVQVAMKRLRTVALETP